MLNDERPIVAGGLKGHAPAIADGLIVSEGFKRDQITTGESDVEPFHPRPIVEGSVSYACLDLDGDVAVERRKVTETSLLGGQVKMFSASRSGIRHVGLWWRGH